MGAQKNRSGGNLFRHVAFYLSERFIAIPFQRHS
jgi:hypothetical protein